ncbi:MAG: hypothetical protein Q9159_001210 [Coniocarpon cinnabarinum]
MSSDTTDASRKERNDAVHQHDTSPQKQKPASLKRRRSPTKSDWSFLMNRSQPKRQRPTSKSSKMTNDHRVQKSSQSQKSSRSPEPREPTPPPSATHPMTVGCLFTRENYGKPKGKTQKQDIEDILTATEESWSDLLRQVAEIDSSKAKNTPQSNDTNDEEVDAVGIGALFMPKINGGLFKVPWERTEEVLRKGGKGQEGWRRECWVYCPD